MVLNVNGDSMDKIIPDGSLIAVKPIELTEIKNGDIVVFSNVYEYSVKRYYKHDDKLVFRPESSNLAHFAQTYSVNDDVTIHGKKNKRATKPSVFYLYGIVWFFISLVPRTQTFFA